MASQLGSDVTLADLVRERARAASDGTLTTLAACGICVVVGTIIWSPRGWAFLVCPAVGAIAFGAYGVADRELIAPRRERSPGQRRLLAAVRSMALVMSILAMFGLLIASFPVVLGTWIS